MEHSSILPFCNELKHSAPIPWLRAATTQPGLSTIRALFSTHSDLHVSG